MGLLKRVNRKVKAGLSANAVRLLTGEPEPVIPVHRTEKVISEPAHHHRSAKTQLGRRLELRAKKKAKRRG